MKDQQGPAINVADVALSEKGDGDAFAVKVARVGPAIGLTKLGCTVTVVPPGKRAYPFHKHHVTDELFFILSGTGENRHGTRTFPVKAGDLIAAAAGGEAHQLINTGSEDLRYLAISNLPEADILEYPDTGKVAYGAGVKNGDMSTATVMALGRLTPAEYYEGEPSGKRES